MGNESEDPVQIASVPSDHNYEEDPQVSSCSNKQVETLTSQCYNSATLEILQLFIFWFAADVLSTDSIYSYCKDLIKGTTMTEVCCSIHLSSH